MKSIVVYFTPSEGNTKLLADLVTELSGSDSYRIEPVVAYPEEYFACNNRAKDEYENNTRPEIKGPLPLLDGYDVIYLGFPNWYRTYPKVIATFIESVQLKGKVIKPFCTNEEGGFGIAELQLRSALPECDVKDGFSVKAENVEGCQSALKDWINR